jgi:hypothetical protein
MRGDVDSMLREIYLRLRSAEGDKSKVQELESDLSSFLLETEERLLTIKKAERDQSVYAKTRAKLKRIADGLAWKSLGFDEIRLLSYAGNPTPGFMAGKAGYYQERLVVKTLSAVPDVTFAIQNDITNILRVGDVTILLPDRTIKVIEVKSGSEGPGAARAARQEERAKVIHTYLQTGTSTNLIRERAGEVRHIQGQDPSAYYWRRLERVCVEALSRGVMWKRLDARVMVMCYRPHLLPRLQPLMQTALVSAGWANASIRFGVLSRHFEYKEKASASVRYIIPITAFEVDPEVISSILNGDLDVLVFLNVTAVVDAIREAGLEVECKGRQVIINTEAASLTVSERSWNWIIYGLRTVPTLIKSIQTTLLAFSDAADMKEAP